MSMHKYVISICTKRIYGMEYATWSGAHATARQRGNRHPPQHSDGVSGQQKAGRFVAGFLLL